MNRLAGKTALITGASRGIGKAIAAAYAAEGADLILNARDESRLKTVAAEISAAHAVQTTTLAADIAAEKSAVEMVAQAQNISPIDILVNNAGIHIAAPFCDYRFDDFKKVIDVNVHSVFLVTRAVLPAMIERRVGRIVNIASTAGKWGSRNQSAYNASKHAVIGLTRCLALEMAPHNINVNAICPWVVETDMAKSFLHGHAIASNVSTEELATAIQASVPIKRWIQPVEVANLAVYLGSDEASFVNGQAWAIDGGYTMI